MSSWRKWVTRPVPADLDLPTRAHWEWGHAIIALTEILGFIALIAAVLADTPRNARCGRAL